MNEHIRVVVYKSEGWWVIHGLDYEFVTLARDLEEVPGEIRRWLSVLFTAYRQLRVEPFHGYAPAPRRYWEMYERAEAFVAPTPLVGAWERLAEPLRIEARLAA